MVNPHWPHLPKRKDNYETNEEEDGIEGAWRTIPDDPLDYHFYYHILDGDEAGYPPKILSSESDKWLYNEQFDRKSKSCLHLIAKSKNKVIMGNQGGLVVINHASHLCDPGSALASGRMWAEFQSISI